MVKRKLTLSELKQLVAESQSGKVIHISDYFNTRSEAIAAIQKMDLKEKVNVLEKPKSEKLKTSTTPTPKEVSATAAKMEVTDPFIWKMLDCAYTLIHKMDTDGLLATYWIDQWIKKQPMTNGHPAKPSMIGFQILYGTGSDLKEESCSYKALKKVYDICIAKEVEVAHAKKEEGDKIKKATKEHIKLQKKKETPLEQVVRARYNRSGRVMTRDPRTVKQKRRATWRI